MNIRKVGRVKASEVKAYQVANGLQVDGKAGNQTVGHMLDALEACWTQPDDPGDEGDWILYAAGLFIIVVFAVAWFFN